MSVFPRIKSKTQSSLNFLQSGPRKFRKSDFSGLAPIRRVLKASLRFSMPLGNTTSIPLFGHFLRGSSSQGQVAQLLAGTDAGTGVRGHVGVWGGILLFSLTVWAGSGGRGGMRTHTHTHTHTQTHTHTHTHIHVLTRECCTYPLATYLLKSARLVLDNFLAHVQCRSLD